MKGIGTSLDWRLIRVKKQSDSDKEEEQSFWREVAQCWAESTVHCSQLLPGSFFFDSHALFPRGVLLSSMDSAVGNLFSCFLCAGKPSTLLCKASSLSPVPPPPTHTHTLFSAWLCFILVPDVRISAGILTVYVRPSIYSGNSRQITT